MIALKLQLIRTASTLQLIYANSLKEFGQVAMVFDQPSAIAIEGLVLAVLGLQALEMFLASLNDPTYDQPIPWRLFLGIAGGAGLSLVAVFVFTHSERYRFTFNRDSGTLEITQTRFLIQTTHHPPIPLNLIKTVTREPETVTLIHSAKQRRKYKRDQTVVTLQRLVITLSSGRRIPLDPSYVASDYRAVSLAPESLQQQALHEIQAFLENTTL